MAVKKLLSRKEISIKLSYIRKPVRHMYEVESIYGGNHHELQDGTYGSRTGAPHEPRPRRMAGECRE